MLIGIAIAACIAMFSNRLGLSDNVDVQNWGIILAVGSALILLVTPDKAKG